MSKDKVNKLLAYICKVDSRRPIFSDLSVKAQTFLDMRKD